MIRVEPEACFDLFWVQIRPVTEWVLVQWQSYPCLWDGIYLDLANNYN